MFDFNNIPQPDFEGFSPKQMYQIIHFPFEDSCPIKINKEIPIEDSPIFKIALDLLLILKENKIKLTQKGNLPIKIVLQISGLTKKQRGVLSLTKRGHSLLKQEDYTGLFFEFLKAYSQEFNWGYSDYIDSENVGQLAFLYSLFLLNKYGDEYRTVDFYTDLYLRAFPLFLTQFEEKNVRYAYEGRFVNKFSEWFGFAETKMDNSSNPLVAKILIRKSNLLRALMK